MQLTLKPEVEALLQQELSTGRFDDPNDVLETALHALADHLPYNAAEMEAMIQQGLDEVERGEVVTEQEARAYIAEMRSKLER